MANPLTRPVVPGVDAERIAEQTHFHYNPVDPSTSRLTLNFREFLVTANGVLPDRIEGIEHVSVTLGEVRSRCFGNGIGEHGVDLSKISAGDILQVMRGMAAALYVEDRDAHRIP